MWWDGFLESVCVSVKFRGSPWPFSVATLRGQPPWPTSVATPCPRANMSHIKTDQRPSSAPLDTAQCKILTYQWTVLEI
jgi:hypothetical protein